MLVGYSGGHGKHCCGDGFPSRVNTLKQAAPRSRVVCREPLQGQVMEITLLQVPQRLYVGIPSP